MQIYSKSMKNATSSIQKSQQICTVGGDVYYASRNLLSTCFHRIDKLKFKFIYFPQRVKRKNIYQY